MKTFKNLFFVSLLVFLSGCSVNKTQIEQETLPPAVPGGTSYGETEDTAKVDAITGATKAEMKIVALAGASYGGIVHNREMAGISGFSDIDAITGATKLAYNAGIHSILKGHGRTVEIGLDYIKVNKSIEYDMPSFSVNGTRSFEAHQIRLPLTYNFGFFKNKVDQARFVFKIGLSPGYTFSKTIEDSEGSENMPDYEFSSWDVCGNFGFYYYPFNFKQDYRMGFYLDFCRGLKAYNDIYHESWTQGGNALMNFGVVFEP
ncbi:hypothetical protein JW879_00555 [candidate division WOR-3 bacterium]|nr:hypothetical protein [candidate division WOR-3 bacterium]